MEKDLKNKYKQEVVELLLSRFNVKYCESELVGSHQSFVYKAQLSDEVIYIRITLSLQRSINQIRAELDIIKYLDDHNFDVAVPIKSLNDKYIETITMYDTVYVTVAFKEAKGFVIGQYPWSLEVPHRVGIMNGKLHNLLEKYEPTGIPRIEWYENDFLHKAKDYLPEEHDKVLEVINDLISEIKSLPKLPNSYGLIHADMVACNYNMTDEKITLFDFDEACYCWFINDIAINVFYDSLGWKGIVDEVDTIESFEAYISGYQTVRKIDSFWISKIHLFLRLREIIVYVAMHRSKDLDALDMWGKNFIKDRKEKIENKQPFINIDFTKYL